MGVPHSQEKKSLSTRIEICGTGKLVDDTVRVLIDEWVVPNLVEVFFAQIREAGNDEEHFSKATAADVANSGLPPNAARK